jgi:outer membrane receptor protein involved in Fe transport
MTLLGIDGRLRQMRYQHDEVDFDSGAYLRSSQGIIRAADATLGVFVQQTWQPWSQLLLNAGARYDFDARFAPVLSPRLAATVNAWPGGSIKATYAEAFRAPSWSETSLQINDVVAAESLVPERVRAVELSLSQKVGTHRVSTSIFRSSWRNLIELHALTPAEVVAADAAGKIDMFERFIWYQYRNVSSIDNYGFTGGYEGSSAGGALGYALNVTGAIARRSDASGVEQPVEVAPRFFGNSRIHYDLPGDLPMLALAAQFKTRALTDRSLDGGWPSTPTAPGQLQIRATVSGPVPVWRGLSYRFSADYAVADRTPYVAGIHQLYRPSYPEYGQWHLVPVDTFRVTAGFQFDFDARSP